jgi:RpiB/LacA/LacB family sugar-phosphate isomerase
MKTVLFVCTGNICRSPMAEGLFRHATDPTQYRAISAGVAAMDGQRPSEYSVQALREVGVDISHQRSSSLTPELVDQADLIFGMTHGHVEEIRSFFPRAAEKTYLLRGLEAKLPAAERTISDPIGGSIDIYRECRDEIASGIRSIVRFLEGKPQSISVAIGADHGGFALKEAIKKQLLEAGIKTHDFGVGVNESVDYPDFAQPVAEAVTQGDQDFGVLICTTGLGMSIAANKVPGARAALVCNKEMADLARRHNDSNILCLGSQQTSVEQALEILEVFLSSGFDGGRHQRRVAKLESGADVKVKDDDLKVKNVDPEIYNVIQKEIKRQQENIELIASENFTSPAVMEVQGSALTNKYAEGYPGKRWYGGCEFVDVAEQLAIDRAKQLFGAEHANVQAHSGSGANMIVYFAFLNPGDKILTMDLSHGGHLTHGNKANFSGKFFDVVHYGVNQETELLNYDEIERLAHEHRPRMITVGASAYPRVIDFERLGAIAKQIDAYLLADIAHIAGLVATGLHPSPVPHADFVTTTTHKTLRGPRGGLVMCREEYAKKIDSQAFPGVQGGPLMHVIAAKAVCFKEALAPSFKEYQAQVIKNSRALAESLKRNGFRIVSGGTDNHLALVDVGARGLTGKQCQIALDEAGITVNKNTIPFETRSPFQASGIRVGSPAVTTRGLKEPEMIAVGDMISEALLDIDNPETAELVRKRVRSLMSKFPLPY